MKNLEIVFKNKSGKWIVNRSIQDASNGTLSWQDVIDLIDEALDDGEYPAETVLQLNAFREKILADIYAERGLFEARRPPKKQAKNKEETPAPTKPAGHTYFLTERFRQAKAKKKAARAAREAKALIDGPPKRSKKKKKKPKFLITPMSGKRPNR